MARRSLAPLLLLTLALAAPTCPPRVHVIALDGFRLEIWPVVYDVAGGAVFEATFAARLTNEGSVPDEVQVWAADPTGTWTVTDGALRFGPLAPGETAPARDVLRLRGPHFGVPFDPAALDWQLLDRFGGWKDIPTTASGRFRVEQIADVWWFVTPEGHGMFNLGPSAVRYAGDFSPPIGTAPYGDNNDRIHGSEAAWAAATEERIRGWLYNTLGSWTASDYLRATLPHPRHLSFARHAPEIPVSSTLPFNRPLRDFWDPAFAAGAAAEAQGALVCAASEWCYGVFSDNELPFGSFIFEPVPHLDAYATLPAGAPGKLALQAFLDVHYGGDVAAFNAAWGQTLADFDAFQALPGLPPVQNGDPTLEPADRAAARRGFLGVVATQYFKVVDQALEAAAPRVLNLGARFVTAFTGMPAIEAAAPFVDVLSFNNYDFAGGALLVLHNSGGAFFANPFTEHGAFGGLDAVRSQVGDLPMMVTEWFYRINLPGREYPPTLPGVPTFAERPDKVEGYLDEMIDRPFIVGAHWFKYADQPVTGRFDGENQIIGLVDITDVPYASMVERMTAVHGTANPRHAASAGP